MQIFSFTELVEKRMLKDVDMALTIGVFDSMHKGHQTLLKKLKEFQTNNTNSKTMVISFNQNPKQNRANNIDTIRLREKYIKSFEIDYLVLIDFSYEFSKTSGVEFIRLLHTFCRVKLVVVGEDFKCGNIESRVTADNLVHTLETIKSSASVQIIKNVLSSENDRISSTKISELLQKGRLEEIYNLSEKYYEIDLMNIPSKIDHNSLIFDMSKSSQQNLLSARYSAILHYSDESMIDSIITIDASNLIINDSEIRLDGITSVEVKSII